LGSVGVDVAVHRREGRGEKNRADDNKNHGVRVIEFKVAAAHLLQEKQDADGDDHGWSDQGADGASRATASDLIAHLYSSLLRTDENLISAANAAASCGWLLIADEQPDQKASSTRKLKTSKTNSILTTFLRSEGYFCCVA
jgi:hypothetical protein